MRKGYGCQMVLKVAYLENIQVVRVFKSVGDHDHVPRMPLALNEHTRALIRHLIERLFKPKEILDEFLVCPKKFIYTKKYC